MDGGVGPEIVIETAEVGVDENQAPVGPPQPLDVALKQGAKLRPEKVEPRVARNHDPAIESRRLALYVARLNMAPGEESVDLAQGLEIDAVAQVSLAG